MAKTAFGKDKPLFILYSIHNNFLNNGVYRRYTHVTNSWIVSISIYPRSSDYTPIYIESKTKEFMPMQISSLTEVKELIPLFEGRYNRKKGKAKRRVLKSQINALKYIDENWPTYQAILLLNPEG